MGFSLGFYKGGAEPKPEMWISKVNGKQWIDFRVFYSYYFHTLGIS